MSIENILLAAYGYPATPCCLKKPFQDICADCQRGYMDVIGLEFLLCSHEILPQELVVKLTNQTFFCCHNNLPLDFINQLTCHDFLWKGAMTHTAVHEYKKDVRIGIGIVPTTLGVGIGLFLLTTIVLLGRKIMFH